MVVDRPHWSRMHSPTPDTTSPRSYPLKKGSHKSSWSVSKPIPASLQRSVYLVDASGPRLVNILRVSVVPWYCRIDLQAPAVDPARHALAGAHSPFTKPIHHLKTANAVMTEHDERGVVGEPLDVLELRRHAAHRDQLRACDVSLLMLRRLADVDKRDLLARVEAPADILRCDFKLHGVSRQPW